MVLSWGSQSVWVQAAVWFPPSRGPLQVQCGLNVLGFCSCLGGPREWPLFQEFSDTMAPGWFSRHIGPGEYEGCGCGALPCASPRGGPFPITPSLPSPLLLTHMHKDKTFTCPCWRTGFWAEAWSKSPGHLNGKSSYRETQLSQGFTVCPSWKLMVLGLSSLQAEFIHLVLCVGCSCALGAEGCGDLMVTF